ncbi:hypothetical protein OG234_13455 [Streptomyces sp. NBC_01420]|uniref:hypothetical protein n=1 Tax=Streptomyces sp. NBC_01420 TaxID=2903858 RepID=UPI003250A84E
MADTQDTAAQQREQDRKDYEATQAAQEQNSNRAADYTTTPAPSTYLSGGRRS